MEDSWKIDKITPEAMIQIDSNQLIFKLNRGI